MRRRGCCVRSLRRSSSCARRAAAATPGDPRSRPTLRRTRPACDARSATSCSFVGSSARGPASSHRERAEQLALVTHGEGRRSEPGSCPSVRGPGRPAASAAGRSSRRPSHTVAGPRRSPREHLRHPWKHVVGRVRLASGRRTGEHLVRRRPAAVDEPIGDARRPSRSGWNASATITAAATADRSTSPPAPTRVPIPATIARNQHEERTEDRVDDRLPDHDVDVVQAVLQDRDADRRRDRRSRQMTSTISTRLTDVPSRTSSTGIRSGTSYEQRSGEGEPLQLLASSPRDRRNRITTDESGTERTNTNRSMRRRSKMRSDRRILEADRIRPTRRTTRARPANSANTNAPTRHRRHRRGPRGPAASAARAVPVGKSSEEEWRPTRTGSSSIRRSSRESAAGTAPASSSRVDRSMLTELRAAIPTRPRGGAIPSGSSGTREAISTPAIAKPPRGSAPIRRNRTQLRRWRRRRDRGSGSRRTIDGEGRARRGTRRAGCVRCRSSRASSHPVAVGPRGTTCGSSCGNTPPGRVQAPRRSRHARAVAERERQA